MRHTWTLTKLRLLLAIRNRAFFFFGLVMPFLFLFGAIALFARGERNLIAYILGAILTFTVMGAFWGVSVQLVTFREQGVLRRFHLSPVGAGPMLASGILANYLLALPPVALEIIVCRWIFHLASWGNVLGIFVLVTCGSAAFASFGMTVASVTNTMQETQMINNLLWMGLIFLSGATVPLTKFPHWIQHFALFIPATYLATGLEASTTNLATAGQILLDSLALVLGLVVSFEISRQLFRWEPETKAPRRAKLWVLAAMIPFLAFGAYQNVWGKQLRVVQQQYDRIGKQIQLQQVLPR